MNRDSTDLSANYESARRVFKHAVSLLLILVFFHLWAGTAYTADLPSRPLKYFNDLDSLVKPSTADQLNRELVDFERRTSNRVLLIIYPKLPNEVPIGQYGVKLVHAWKLDQRGAVIVVDVQNHLLRIQAGGVLKETLSEGKCKKIFTDVIMPRFKVDDYDGGLKAGVDAVIAAVSTRSQH